MAAVYNRHEYLDDRRDALAACDSFVERPVSGQPDNVVALRAG